MASRRKPNLKRRVIGKAKKGVPYIPVIPPAPGADFTWDEELDRWIKNGTYVDKDHDGKAA